ncbi:MAG: tRNA methyl transferase PRC-barrel domain-containing protein, partial [Traorella sp.]
KTLFPIGHITKPEVRELALEYDLNVAKKKDSTGICFIGERNFKEFLKNYLPAKEGEIVDINTLKVVGHHQGVLYYTLGQRKGMGIGGDHGPYFVVGKDVQKNILYVSCENDSMWLYSDSCLVSGVNWFSNEKFSGELTCTAKFRYRQKDNDVKIRFINENTIFVTMSSLVSAVTPGQEAVFYLDEVCLGGGVIEDVFYQGISLDKRIEERIKK